MSIFTFCLNIFNSIEYFNGNEPFHEKTNIVGNALSIDPDQTKHVAQAYRGRHFSPPVDFLFQESS